jgi:hypothetical protein
MSFEDAFEAAKISKSVTPLNAETTTTNLEEEAAVFCIMERTKFMFVALATEVPDRKSVV